MARGSLGQSAGICGISSNNAPPRPGLFQLIQALLARPQRIVRAGLATAWVVIATLNLATRETSKPASISNTTAPTTPETLQALKQQRLLYAELVGRRNSIPQSASKATARPAQPTS